MVFIIARGGKLEQNAFLVLCFTFKSLVNLALIFVYNMRPYSKLRCPVFLTLFIEEAAFLMYILRAFAKDQLTYYFI